MADRHDPTELIADPGVLEASPLLELGGWRGVEQREGVCILPWRADWLSARARKLEAYPDAESLGPEPFNQALVHLQKSRDATWNDLRTAWQRLETGGRLLFCGGNDLGIVSAVKRLARELDQAPQILSNRRRARIVSFERPPNPCLEPTAPDTHRLCLPWPGGDPLEVEAAAGVFSARKIDSGTEMLLSALRDHGGKPDTIFDLGCGIGCLGLVALKQWPDAQATMADGDARAIASAERNAQHLGVAERCRIIWWDAREAFPDQAADLVLLNPPFHTGRAVDLEPAREMFKRAGESLRPGGTALIVANRTLPYERDLEAVGRLQTLTESRHYKLLSLRRRSRSSSSSKAHSPGRRSSGRS
ncbi:MAG: methyltransferase [Myxococcota bacterium]|nr:methyltransferase [Myxococcota bacterium]